MHRLNLPCGPYWRIMPQNQKFRKIVWNFSYGYIDSKSFRLPSPVPRNIKYWIDLAESSSEDLWKIELSWWTESSEFEMDISLEINQIFTQFFLLLLQNFVFYITVTGLMAWLFIPRRKFVAQFSVHHVPSVTKISKKVCSLLKRRLLR